MAEAQQYAPEIMNFETSVASVITRADGVKSFRFHRPEGFTFRAGQWMYVNIKVDGTNKLHHFTISASPTETYLEFTKKITDHPYSRALDQMKGGEWARINGPFGDFVLPDTPEKLGFLTGGIGITPMRSMLRCIADRNLRFDVVMLYSNKTEADIVFREELDKLASQHLNLKVKHVLTREPDWKGLKGHVDAKMVKEQIPDYRERTFYICGPPAMNEGLKKALQELGLPEEKIRLEDFTGY